MSAIWILFAQLPPVTPTVRPTSNLNDVTTRVQINSVVSAIGVRLQVTSVVFQELLGPSAFASSGKVVNGVGMILVANVRPEPGKYCAPLSTIDQLDLRVVRVNHFGLKHASLHERDERLHKICDARQPVVNGAATDVDAVTREYVLLSITR